MRSPNGNLLAVPNSFNHPLMTLDSLHLGSMAPMAPMTAVLEAAEVSYSNPRQLDVKYVCQPQCYDSCHPCVTLDSLHLGTATTTTAAAAASAATAAASFRKK